MAYARYSRFDQYGNYTGEPFPADCIRECSAPGSVDSAVEYWREHLNFKVDRAIAVRYLVTFGAWDRAELESLPDTELADKVLWIACCDINENGEWFGMVE